MIAINTIYNEHCLETMARMQNEFLDCIITSPPYWRLRDYGVIGQIGSEDSFDKYIANLINIFKEVKRVLKKSGTCFVNLGDVYGTTSGRIEQILKGKSLRETKYSSTCNFKINFVPAKENKKHLKMDKSLLQIPSRFAIAMCNNGWILRNEIIWHKPNSKPSSATDRFTVDFEKVFFFVKNRKYNFNTIYENSIWAGKDRRALHEKPKINKGKSETGNYACNKVSYSNGCRKIKRTVWSVQTKGSNENHFAMFPEELIKPMILAGSPIGGIVYDPFMGTGTTAVVSLNLDRNYIGSEINQEYCQKANNKLELLKKENKLFDIHPAT